MMDSTNLRGWQKISCDLAGAAAVACEMGSPPDSAAHMIIPVVVEGGAPEWCMIELQVRRNICANNCVCADSCRITPHFATSLTGGRGTSRGVRQGWR